MNRGVGALDNLALDVLGNVDGGPVDAEVLRAFLLECRDESDVEVGAGVVSKREKHLHVCRCVAHEELDGSSSHGPGSAVAADSVLTAAGEGTQNVFIEAAGGGIDQLEVGRDEREESAEEELRTHFGV